MKEATGELNMTVITVIAIAAIAAIFYAFVWPAIQGGLTATTRCNSAYGCKSCDASTKRMKCSGYYGEGGSTVPSEIECDCK